MQSNFLLALMPLVLSISMAEQRTKSPNENQQHVMAVPPKSTKAPVLIDSIRQHYLGLENDLWSLMDSGIDNAYVLDRIHTVHLQFFVENFGELNVTFCDYAFDRQIELFDAVSSINQTILLVLEKSLRQNPLTFDEKATIETNRHQIDLTHQLEILFNMTGTSEFYETIQRKAELKRCDKNVAIIKSANQLIYEYYHDVSTAELKAYALIQLAYMFYTVYNRGSFRRDAQILRTKYLEHTQQTQENVRNFLTYSKRDIWRCDPNHYTIGTYEEVTNFLNGYMDNEVNLNQEQTCQNTCDDYRVTQNFGCFDGTYCAQKTEGNERDRAVCKGKVVNCEFLGSDLNVCSSPYEYSKRYDVLYYDNGNVLGRNGSERFQKCEDESTRVTSWTRWLVKCTNCFCLCDDQRNSERHFSLREVVSDISRNRVVSGIALRKFQGVFHFVVTDRELRPYATLDTSTPTWNSYSSVNYFHVHDSHVREGIDYHTLNWENRSINLDTIEVPTGKVVTGVRFRIVDNTITMQVRATEFDLITGRLTNLERSQWYISDKKNRTEINLDNLDVPILTPEKSIPNIQPNLFVRFGPTDKFKDLAQTTIPYIDAQLVEPHNAVPLGGAGLLYKAFSGYGGFIAPKILNYNLAPHIAYGNQRTQSVFS